VGRIIPFPEFVSGTGASTVVLSLSLGCSAGPGIPLLLPMSLCEMGDNLTRQGVVGTRSDFRRKSLILNKVPGFQLAVRRTWERNERAVVRSG